jgi:hypothetical protein
MWLPGRSVSGVGSHVGQERVIVDPEPAIDPRLASA